MINLTDFGYTDFFQRQTNDDNLITARVTAVHREQYIIMSQHGENGAKLKGAIYFQDGCRFEYPTTGDFVMVSHNEHGDSIIYETLKRKSCFQRSDGFSAIGVQTVSANFDYVFIMASLNNDFNVKRIERYLATAWQSGGTPVVILTKADLVADYSTQLLEIQKACIGVDVIAISALTGFGLDRLSCYLVPGKTLVFLGSSGVGKSSLLNALAGDQVMLVNAIRDNDGKGRHTTTHRQLIMLPSGVMIIDTPGMRELGMWKATDGVGETFSDIEQLFKRCKFADCTHQCEPHCGVLMAIADGTLEQSRYDSYLALKREARFAHSKAVQVARKQNKLTKIKKYDKSNRQFKGGSE